MRTPSKHTLLLLNKAAGSPNPVTMERTHTIDDEVGDPIVSLQETKQQPLAGTAFFRSEIEAAGLTPDDIPNLQIIEDNEL